MRYFKLTYEPLIVEETMTPLQHDALGAHVLFVGTVRNQSKNKRVVELDFEAYEPMAVSELELIADKIEQKWSIEHILLYHRLGKVAVGEIPVIAAISSKHRTEAFEACAFLMDKLKETVPIWKKEIFEDGSEWVSATP